MQTFNGRSTLLNDACYVDSRESQDKSIENYNLLNYYSAINPTCAQKLATENPTILFRDGYGSIGRDGRLVSNDSYFKTNATTMTHFGNKQILNRRLFTSIPFKGRGLGNSNIEREFVEGNDTGIRRQCNTLSEISIPHFFTPLVPFLAKNVQDPIHLIPEDNETTWLRGGCPSRQVIRDRLNNKCQKCPARYRKLCECR